MVAESTGSFYGQPMTAGDIYTVAGDGSRGFSGDGGGHQGRAQRPVRRGGRRRGQPADRRPPETGGSGWWPADAGDGAVPGPPDLAYRAVPAPPGSVAHLCLPRRAG